MKSEKRIIFAGNNTALKRELLEELTHSKSRFGMEFTVAKELEQGEAGDYVFLFAGQEETGRIPEVTEFLKLLEQVKKLEPSSAVLVTDTAIYGKSFGQPHLLKENEFGYVCHTSEEDRAAQLMRTAEHFACRMVRESGLNLKVARAAERQTGDERTEMAERAVKVLLFGRAGEPYNLLSGKMGESPSSPLSPREILTDDTKVRTLDSESKGSVCCCGTI